MVKPVSPCIDCGDRVPGCHAECKGYNQYRTSLDEFNSIIRNGKKKENNYLSFKIGSIRKTKKK